MKRYVISETKTFEYNRSDDIKPWSPKEESRTKELSTFVTDKIFEGGYEEYYAEHYVEDIETYVIEGEGILRDEDVTIQKMNLIYTQNWDENDRRVKCGKPLTGSTYFVVYGEDGAIDETNFAYKTKADAIHAAQLYIDEREQWVQYLKRRESNS